ncbi:hypothetical protein BU17DRAFT_69677 [Hysterangium stoloniferum]|nr:hypothetical protein BU17DRAFT_69677 [Hysterangium stoloniferum]
MSNSSGEEEDREILRSNPWKWEQVIQAGWINWVLETPPFPCIPQLDSLEYSVIDSFDSTNDSTEVMKVYTKVNGIEKLAILKVYQVPSRYRDTRLDGFIREFVAYSNLTHFGLCDEGLVPHCYGWYDFASDDPVVLSERHPYVPFIWEDEVAPRALLLEYLEDAVPLSAENYTPQMAPAVVDALQRIQSFGIIHRDPEMRNIVVRPDGNTFWVKASFSLTFESLTMF